MISGAVPLPSLIIALSVPTTTTLNNGTSTPCTYIVGVAFTVGKQASGVGVHPDCVTAFQALKLKKQHKYIIFTLNESFSEIVVDKTSTVQDYDDFISDLPETECRWAIYDFEFEKEGGGKRNKIVFLSW